MQKCKIDAFDNKNNNNYSIMLLLLFIQYSIFVSILGYTHYLSPTHWKQIKLVLDDPHSTETMRFQTRKLIYTRFEKWAVNKAYEFSKKYRFHKQLDPKELSLYALSGLEKAVIKYNTSYAFIYHAEFYVTNSLFNGITDLQPINFLPKSYRKSKAWRKKNPALYERLLKTQFVGEDEWILDQSKRPVDILDNCLYKEIDIWAIVHTMSSFYQQIFLFKYNPNYQFSNKKIAEIFSCSEENIRLHMIKIHKEILLILNNHTNNPTS